MVNIYTTQFPFYLKTSFLTNTKNLAKTKEMLHNLFNLFSLKTKQPVKEICKPYVLWREEFCCIANLKIWYLIWKINMQFHNKLTEDIFLKPH